SAPRPCQGRGRNAGWGPASYTIFVSENGGPFVPFLADTAAMSETFVGRDGSSYAFYSVARDVLGNAEGSPTTPDATTRVAQCPPEGCDQPTTSTTVPGPPTTTTVAQCPPEGCDQPTTSTTVPGPPPTTTTLPCRTARCIFEAVLTGVACA